MSNFENNCFYLENNEPKMNEYVESWFLEVDWIPSYVLQSSGEWKEKVSDIYHELSNRNWLDIGTRISLDFIKWSILNFPICCGQLKLATSLEVKPSFSSAIIGDSPPLLLCGR